MELLETSVTPSHNATQASQHAAKLIGSQVDMPDVSSRELSCKHSETGRRAKMSRARNLVQRLSVAIRDPFSRLERQEARPEAVLDARGPVQKPSWTPGGPSRGGLGRQEARPQAVLGGRRPECKFYCSFAGKCRFCAGVSLGSRSAKFQKRQAFLRNFCVDFRENLRCLVNFN